MRGRRRRADDDGCQCGEREERGGFHRNEFAPDPRERQCAVPFGMLRIVLKQGRTYAQGRTYIRAGRGCMSAGHEGDERKSLVARGSIGQHGNAMKSTRSVLICAALILMLAMGVRQTMGLLLPPMTLANGWSRDDFAFAIALQNLLWGASVPFAGAIADRYGAGRVLATSALVYALGLMTMAFSSTPAVFGLSAGLLIGLALSGTTFGVVLGVVSKVVSPEKRSVALGIASAGGSFGQ